MQVRDVVLERLIRCNGDTTRIHEILDSVGDVGPFTLEEIGQVLGITRERVRQIEQRAMVKLKHPSVGRKLKQYLETHIRTEPIYSQNEGNINFY